MSSLLPSGTLLRGRCTRRRERQDITIGKKCTQRLLENIVGVVRLFVRFSIVNRLIHYISLASAERDGAQLTKSAH